MERIQIGGRRVAGFGVGSWYSAPGSKELEALVKMSDDRMKTLSDAFQTFGPKWIVTDPAGYGVFLTDYNLLQGRYVDAKAKATAAMGFWAGASEPVAAYDAISKAFRQNYQPGTTVVPPGESTVSDVKGDWADLWKRIHSAQGAAGTPQIVDNSSTDLAKMQSNDPAMAFFRATAPLDVVAQVTGAQAPGTAVGGALDTIRWIEEHKIPLAIGATVMVGGILYAIIRR